MRIGRTIIDLDSLTVEDLTAVITEARAIRKRKEKAEELKRRMTELINEAKDNNFDFIDKDYGNVLEPTDFILYDNV